MLSLCGPGALSAASGLSQPGWACTAGRTVQGPAVRLGAVVLLLLLLCWAQLTSGSLEVVMQGRTQTVLLNNNVTISCKASGFRMLDPSTVGIRWYQKNQVSKAEDMVLELYGDTKDVRQPGTEVSLKRLQSGDASLQLPGVHLWDAGVYRCRVAVPYEKAHGTVLLEVLAPPNCTLNLEQTTEKNKESHSSHSSRLACQCHGFHSKDINRTWVKWNHSASQDEVISEGNWTDPVITNENATFTITSYLVVNSTEDNLYCEVQHPSLPTPLRLNITVPVGGTILITEYAAVTLKKKAQP
ncbi:natural cytotoxicity triggering receptor 3 ligand 1-like isoform X2 [Octodon degus]|uniref:Natural cytotoxicity triggering receptor 3 ligand 1-like isoform X2 n=1 Tax=Octodon degus TaxID=10160 RepID=A0A6P6ES18_OCTDE|nr:natural cytotoxicity triggering receptor 3 ligand 1-like isoform X2 [Octodon degus]